MDADLSGKLIAGRYRLTRQIGKGGMGAVWVAVQEQLGREVALKLIRPELVHEARVRERFRREARLVAQLNNPHVVGVIDFGEAEAPGGDGTTLFPNPPADFHGTPAWPRWMAPSLGQHSDEVLRELGKDETERKALFTKGVVA